MERCPWAGSDQQYIKYHDEEWGVPLYDDHRLFEFLILETMQAGLSWLTILKKRENFREALDFFDVQKICSYSPTKVDSLMKNSGVIRNRRKLESVVSNAQHFIDIQKEWGTFRDYIWDFVGGKPIKNKWRTLANVPATTPISDKIAKDLKQRGFKFVGSTVIYAHMQATGMVNDHLTKCFRYHQV